MKVGFTGTQSGMTVWQRQAFETLIQRLHPSEFHHGLCQGADAQAHDAVKYLCPLCRIVGHPPIDGKKMETRLCHELREPKDYLVRNEDIARECHVVIATPKEHEETVRSGTWATVRRARKAFATVIIIWPTGKVTKETRVKPGEGLPIAEDVA